MRPVTSKFLTSLRGSHNAQVEAYVVDPGQTGVSPTGTEILILDGDVQLDSTSPVRSTLELVTDGTGMFPDSASDLFAPYGNELFIRRGVAYGGQSFEWVSLGYFRINATEQDNAPNGPIRIQAQDRMIGIIEARLLAPIQFAATETYGDVVDYLVQEVYPWATVEWDDLTDTDALGRAVIAEEERYDFLDDLITSRGKIWYWDYRGVLVIKDVPDPDDPVWEVDAGENGVLISLARDLSREGVYNAVVATGEALDTATPSTAVAVDNNPDSPTYYYGDFGKVPRFYSSPFITTDAQALTAAESLLKKKLGLPYNVDFSTVPNPALEPWDPIAVNLAGTESVPVRKVGYDTFGRTVVDSFGTADSGQAWSMSGTVANFDVTGGVGTFTAPSSNFASYAVLDGVVESDVDGYFTAAVPVAATGSTLVFGGVTRYSFSGTASYYKLRIEFRADGQIGVKISRYLAGVFEELAANNPVPGRTYTAAQRWRVRFRSVGSVHSVKAWPESEGEPSSWTLQVVDDALTSGSVGVWFWRLASNTNTGTQFNIDNWEVNTFPGLASGAEVHVIERLTVPLDVTQPMTGTTREQTLIVIGEG
jgi:uncharacterized protein DUF5047